MKELGSSHVLPRVYDFFPNTARGHGAQPRYKKVQSADGTWRPGPRRNNLCVVPNCELVSHTGRGERHKAQDQNRKDWEESVGIRRASSTTHTAFRAQSRAVVQASDPKSQI